MASSASRTRDGRSVVDTGQKGEGDKDSGDDSQRLHDQIHPVADLGEVEVVEPVDHIAVSVDHIEDENGMVEEVTAEQPGGFFHQRVICAGKAIDGFPQGRYVRSTATTRSSSSA